MKLGLEKNRNNLYDTAIGVDLREQSMAFIDKRDRVTAPPKQMNHAKIVKNLLTKFVNVIDYKFMYPKFVWTKR